MCIVLSENDEYEVSHGFANSAVYDMITEGVQECLLQYIQKRCQY